MSKLNKILSAIMITCTILCSAFVVTYAATGESVITIIKEIVEKNVYYLNDIEVTEDEFNSAKQIPQTEVIEREVEHRLYTDFLYKINGVYVTKDEYLNYLNSSTSEESAAGEYLPNNELPDTKYSDSTGVKEIVLTANDLIGANAGSLGDYLLFGYDNYGHINSATIDSDKVIEVRYDYNENGYLGYAEKTANGYVFNSTCFCTYQKTECGMYFTQGIPTSYYFVAGVDQLKTMQVDKGTTVFFFERDYDRSAIDFGFIFDSITLVVKE